MAALFSFHSCWLSIHFSLGIVIGMAAMLPYEQQVRLNILAKNAADHARRDRAAKRQAQKVAA